MDERGFEMFALAAVPVGTAILERTVGWNLSSPALRRQELERLRNQERAFRQALRQAIVESATPEQAIDVVKIVLDRADDDTVARVSTRPNRPRCRQSTYHHHLDLDL